MDKQDIQDIADTVDSLIFTVEFHATAVKSEAEELENIFVNGTNDKPSPIKFFQQLYIYQKDNYDLNQIAEALDNARIYIKSIMGRNDI